jgi:glutamyl-tRNA reductase
MSALWRIGLDGGAVPFARRERWALAEPERDALHAVARTEGWGLVTLATCHRLEVYLEASAAGAEAVRQWLAGRRAGLDQGDLDVRQGDAAAEHLFRVGAGLESAVLGEAQVLGQVRRARAHAEQAGTLSPLLQAAFAEAIALGRRARRETGIGRGVASTASAAVELAARAAGGLRGRHVVVVGGGEIGRLLVKHLAGRGLARLDLVSRSAEVSGATSHPPEALASLLHTADVLLAATDRQVLDAAALAGRGEHPLAIVDLGMPRNVAPDVAACPGVRLYDVDALRGTVAAALEERRRAIPAAEALIAEAVGAFAETSARVERERLVAELRRRAEATRREAIAYACRRCDDPTCEPKGPPSDRSPGLGPCSDPDRLTRTLTTRLLHDLTRGLRATPGLDDATLRHLLALPEG